MIKHTEIPTLKKVKAVNSGLIYDVCGFYYEKAKIAGFKINTSCGEATIKKEQFNLFEKYEKL